MQNPRNQLDQLKNQLDTGERGGSKDDRNALIEFAEELELLSSEYSDHRKLKLLRHCTRMAEEVGGIETALRDKDAAEGVVRWIHSNYDNQETNRDYRIALRVFGRRVTEGEGTPESIDWVPSGTQSSYDPSPEPSDMLRWEEDIQPMIEATYNSRDAAMIAVAFDLGPRGGEFESLKVGDITDGEHGLKVTVRGKQGKRSPTIIPSVPYVNRWLNDHPGTDDPDAPLWCKLAKPESMSYQMLTKVFRKAAERAEVNKPTTLTNFRKSSAAFLASKGMSQAHLEDHHGWVRGSRVASRYVSVFADAADRELARIHGKDVSDDEPDEISPLECPRCGKETPREKDLCVWCGQALEPGAAEEAEGVDDLLVEAIANAEGEDARELMRMRDKVRSNPEIVSDLMDRLGPLLDTD